MRVLIVDDNELNREVLVQLLAPHADDCDTAVDGALGLRAFKVGHARSKPYDLICLDIKMPEMNGQVVLQQIRLMEDKLKIPRADRVKVIMVTSMQDKKSVVDAIYRGGADKYIVKPIEAQRLMEAVQDLGLIARMKD